MKQWNNKMIVVFLSFLLSMSVESYHDQNKESEEYKEKQEALDKKKRVLKKERLTINASKEKKKSGVSNKHRKMRQKNDALKKKQKITL